MGRETCLAHLEQGFTEVSSSVPLSAAQATSMSRQPSSAHGSAPATCSVGVLRMLTRTFLFPAPRAGTSSEPWDASPLRCRGPTPKP